MRTKSSRQRDLWLRVHLTIALIAGLFLALIGLAGSLSVYGEVLDEWLNPALTVEKQAGPSLSLDRIMAAVRAAHPDRPGSWVLELPRAPGRALTAWYEAPAETAGELYAPLMVSVNQYTAEIVASRFWGRTAATWLLDLHTQLHWGRTGWNFVGVLGVMLGASAVTGLYLWWPGVAGLKRAFGFRHDAGALRLALDLHRNIGLFAALPLLALAFTGALLAFPNIPEALVGSSGMSHGDDGPTVRSSALPDGHPVGLDEAVLLARGPFPHAEVRRVATPRGQTGTYRISLRQRSEVNQRHPVTTVWVDQYSGQIREVRNPSRFTAGETALTWLWPLHTGEALGPWGRFLWLLAGLTPGVLYITGLVRWLIGRGSLPDFDVDLNGWRRHVEQVLERAVEKGVLLYRFTKPSISRAAKRLVRLLAKRKESMARLRERRAEARAKAGSHGRKKKGRQPFRSAPLK